MKHVLNKDDRDSILKSLTTQQQLILKDFITNRKKSEFANAMARDKGIVLPENASDEEIEILLDNWILDDYIDNGFINPGTLCECGRPLRYQYIVRHTKTNEVRRFGIIHFEEHMSFPPPLIKAIKKGLTNIDYELDELLIKTKLEWNLSDHIYKLPDNIPTAIKKLIDNNLPLLDTQVNRIFAIIRSSEKLPITKYEIQQPLQTELFSNIPYQSTPGNGEIAPEKLSEIEKEIIRNYIVTINSALVITEALINHHEAWDERYSYTGRPKLFPLVVRYLDTLVASGELIELPKVHGDKTYRKVF